MVIAYNIDWIDRVRLPILLVVSWTWEIHFFSLSSFGSYRVWSHEETGSAVVPSGVSLLVIYTTLRLNTLVF